jgi:hypothetical protein
VLFTTIDGQEIKMLDAEPITDPVTGDIVPESIAGELPLELVLFFGTPRATGLKSYVARVGLSVNATGATNYWASIAIDPAEALEGLNAFDVRRLYPGGQSAAEREGAADELRAYYERSRTRFQKDAKRQLMK